jgi:hypothetical protein
MPHGMSLKVWLNAYNGTGHGPNRMEERTLILLAGQWKMGESRIMPYTTSLRKGLLASDLVDDNIWGKRTAYASALMLTILYS